MIGNLLDKLCILDKKPKTNSLNLHSQLLDENDR